MKSRRKAVINSLTTCMSSKSAKSCESTIYKMCEILSKEYEESINYVYSKYAYEKTGQIIHTGKSSRKLILKDVKNKVLGWDSNVYTEIRNDIEKLNSELVQGIKIEKGEFPCKNKKCGSTECFFFQIQTRSADEPMTVYVTCVECGRMYHF